MEYELKKAVIETKDHPSGTIVSIEIGELRDIIEVIRCQSLELEKMRKSGSRGIDPIDVYQVEARLGYLYKQMTGLNKEEGLWSLK